MKYYVRGFGINMKELDIKSISGLEPTRENRMRFHQMVLKTIPRGEYERLTPAYAIVGKGERWSSLYPTVFVLEEGTDREEVDRVDLAEKIEGTVLESGWKKGILQLGTFWEIDYLNEDELYEHLPLSNPFIKIYENKRAEELSRLKTKSE